MASDKNSAADLAIPELSLWRKKVWPIYSHELKKFLPMVIMMFWILFNYTIVRNLKDNLLVYAPHSSAHVLPWAKWVWVTPASIGFVLLYAKLSNVMSKQKLFYATLIPFGIFFLLFPFVIYPLQHYLHASPETVLGWKQSVKWLADLFPVVGYWTFSLFYMMAEMWGNVAVALLFWQFANQVTPTSEAKRFYPIFGFWSNLGLVCAGLLLVYVEPILKSWDSKVNFAHEVLGQKDFSIQLQFLCSLVVIGCVMVGACYWWMNKYVLSDPRYYDESAVTGKKKSSKPKMSIGESIKFLAKSKYLWYIMVLVLAYGVAINLVEISWKDAIKAYYGDDRTGFARFQGTQYITTGIVTMFLILFSQGIVRNLGWRFAAIITPWVSLITGALFFVFMIFKDKSWIVALTDPIWMAMWLGMAQNCLTKGAKYSLFDPTKEMAYIPLDEESKIKGKAAIDVVGGRMGKSGGSLVNMAVRSVVGGGNPFLMVVGSVMVGICFWWIWAVEKLSGEYHKKVNEKE